jgi:hypothetical protein
VWEEEITYPNRMPERLGPTVPSKGMPLDDITTSHQAPFLKGSMPPPNTTILGTNLPPHEALGINNIQPIAIDIGKTQVHNIIDHYNKKTSHL